MEVDTLSCLEDAVEGFLEDINLFENGDIDYLDFLSPLIDVQKESSDTDSGISVNSKPLLSIQPSLPDVGADCVLAGVLSSPEKQDAVTIDVQNMCNTSELSTHPSDISNKPVRVIKVSSGLSSTNASSMNPRFSSINGAQYTKPQTTGVIHSVKPIIDRSNIHKRPQSIKIISTKQHTFSTKPNSNFELNTSRLNIKHEAVLDIQDANGYSRHVSAEDGMFTPILDRYDPYKHRDTSFEERLRNVEHVNAASFGRRFEQLHDDHSLMSSNGLNWSGPSQNGMMQQSSEHFLSHTHLDRLRKRQERMIKNRQAASLSRLRKKEYLERLEMRYDQLKKENLSLWRQNEDWRMRCDHLERSLNNLQSQLNSYVNESSTETGDANNGKQCGSSLESPHSSDVTPTPNINWITPKGVALLDLQPRSSLTTLSTPGSQPKQTRLSLGGKGSFSNSGTLSGSSTLNTNLKSTNGGLFFPYQSRYHDNTKSRILNLTNNITRSRPSVLPSARSKVAATTTLLLLCCMFSLPSLFNEKPSSGLLSSMNPSAVFNTQSALHPGVSSRQLLSASPDDAAVTTDFEQPSGSNNVKFTVNSSKPSTAPLDDCGPDSRVNSDNIRCPPTIPPNMSSVAAGRALESWLRRQRRKTDSSVPYAASPVKQSSDRNSVRSIRARTHRQLMHRSKQAIASLPESGLQPFRRGIRDLDWQAILNTVGRRNDTLYFMLLQDKPIVLPPSIDPYLVHTDPPTPQKIAFILPGRTIRNATHADDSSYNSRITMVHLDCQIVNATLLNFPSI